MYALVTDWPSVYWNILKPLNYLTLKHLYTVKISSKCDVPGNYQGKSREFQGNRNNNDSNEYVSIECLGNAVSLIKAQVDVVVSSVLCLRTSACRYFTSLG